MTTNRHKYFRWTRRTAWISFAYVMLVPAMLGTAGYMTEVSGTSLRAERRDLLHEGDEQWLTYWQGKWEMRGKRRGDMISEF
jgi:hypothetical protein